MDAHSFIDFLKFVDIWLLFTAHESTLTSLSKEELGFPCGCSGIRVSELLNPRKMNFT